MTNTEKPKTILNPTQVFANRTKRLVTEATTPVYTTTTKESK